MFPENIHHSSIVMTALLLVFAVIHSGGAAFRNQAERLIGARAWRLVFASASIPMAALLISYFLAHRYDGVRIWNFQGAPGIVQFVWIISAVSFFFLYPATYNLLEIPAIAKPKIRLYAKGIIRVTRHPQAIGQILWCLAHCLWIGSSFVLVTSAGLIAHHLFAVWHGDRRLKIKFGEAFEKLKEETSVIPFVAVIDGRQTLQFQEFLRPSQLGIIIAVSIFWWSHSFISLAIELFSSSKLAELLV